MSVVAGAIAKYNAIAMTGVTKPPIWFDGIPQTNASGVLQTATDGYVNLVDEGTAGPDGEVGYDFEYNPIERTQLRFEVFGPTLEYVDLVMFGIKYSTGTTTQLTGFDFGTLTVTGQQVMECRRTHELRARETEMSETGSYVYRGTIWYQVETKVN